MAALALGQAGSFFMVNSVQAILSVGGQCQHCQGWWNCVWRTKGDGAYAPGQSKRSFLEWIGFPFLLLFHFLLFMKWLVLELSHVSFLNNAFSVVGKVFYLQLQIGIFCFLNFFSLLISKNINTQLKNIHLGIPEENIWLSENAQFFPGFVFL